MKNWVKMLWAMGESLNFLKKGGIIRTVIEESQPGRGLSWKRELSRCCRAHI